MNNQALQQLESELGLFRTVREIANKYSQVKIPKTHLASLKQAILDQQAFLQEYHALEEAIKAADASQLASLLSTTQAINQLYEGYPDRDLSELVGLLFGKFEVKQVQAQMEFPVNCTNPKNVELDAPENPLKSECIKSIARLVAHSRDPTFFKPLLDTFTYHFISKSQSTARIDKPEWFLTYLFEIVSLNVFRLEDFDIFQDQEAIGEQLVTYYCLPCIKLRIENNSQNRELFTPEIVVELLESAQIFELNLQTLFPIEGVYNQVVQMINLDDVLEWELKVFQTNLFQKCNYELTQDGYLSYTEDFQLIWKKLYSKYGGIVDAETLRKINSTYFSILGVFVEQSKTYFDKIYKLKDYHEQAIAKVQLIQKYQLGLDCVKEILPAEFSEQMAGLERKTVFMFVSDVRKSIISQIMKHVATRIFNEVCFRFFTCKDKVVLYKHNNLFYIQENMMQYEPILTLNSFQQQTQEVVQRILNEQVIKQKVDVKMSQQIAKEVLGSLAEELLEIACGSIKFSQEGLKVYLLAIARSVLWVVASGLGASQEEVRRVERVGESVSKSKEGEWIEKFNVIL